MPRNVTLHMGFINTPYSQASIDAPIRAARAEFARKQRRGFTSTMTAEDVADILEEKYSIMDVFNEIYGEEISEIVSESFENIIIDIFAEKRKFGSERLVKYMQPKTNQIEKMFRNFINNEEMNGRVEGVPTQASITGKGRRTRKPGHSFVDTGIFRASFRAWVDIK